MGRQARIPRARRVLALALLAAAIALMAGAPSAFGNFFTPEHGGSPNANEINTVYEITLAIALVIFVGVEGALFYALFKFRARKGRAAAQIRGNTRLELGWTIGAALILVVLAVITFVKLGSIRNPPNSGPNAVYAAAHTDGVEFATLEQRLPPNGRSLHISVTGQQYIWRYTYPGATSPTGLGAPYSYEEMVVPTDTTVTLDVASTDVVHSWWIPQLGGKVDAVPGYVNHTWFKISKPGLYSGQCAALCGRGHARMIAAVRAVTPADFEAWIASQKAAIAAANQAAPAARKKLAGQSGAAAIQNP